MKRIFFNHSHLSLCTAEKNPIELEIIFSDSGETTTTSTKKKEKKKEIIYFKCFGQLMKGFVLLWLQECDTIGNQDEWNHQSHDTRPNSVSHTWSIAP